MLEATRDLLVAEGLRAVSLRKVAGSLGVTAPALYAHFASKQDLLQAIAEDEFRKLIAQFQSVDPSTPPVEHIRRQCWTYVDYARENPKLFSTMFLFRPELTSEPRGDELPLATEAFTMAAEPVRRAIESGEFKKSDPIVTSLVLWTATHGVATVLLAGPDLGRAAEDALANAVIETVIAGLSTNPAPTPG